MGKDDELFSPRGMRDFVARRGFLALLLIAPTWEAIAQPIDHHAAVESDAAVAEPDPVVRPKWTARPTADQLARLYPSRGQGITGQTSMDCLVDGSGRLVDCRIVREVPERRRFGESAITLSKYFRMDSLDSENKPVEGRRITIPVRWDPP